MKTISMRLTLDVTFDPQGMTPDELAHMLLQMVRTSIRKGNVTAGTKATVEDFGCNVVIRLPAESMDA